MSEQIMNIPLCFYAYAMVQQQEERQEDGKGKRREPSLFLPCPLIFSFSARTHSNTHTEFKLNPKNFKSEHVVREREWGIWPWYFYFNMCTCKGQKKGRKANNAGSSWKKIIIVGESKVLSDSTDYGWTNAEQLFSRGFMWTTIWRRRPKLFCCLTH